MCGEAKCVCLPGFVRDADGKCLDEEVCPDSEGNPGLARLEEMEVAEQILRNLTETSGEVAGKEEQLRRLDELEHAVTALPAQTLFPAERLTELDEEDEDAGFLL